MADTAESAPLVDLTGFYPIEYWAERWGLKPQSIYSVFDANRDTSDRQRLSNCHWYFFTPELDAQKIERLKKHGGTLPQSNRPKKVTPASELDKLIAAASAVGAENELLKRKLDAIRKLLEE